MKILIVIGLFIGIVVLAKRSVFPSRQDGPALATKIRAKVITLIKSHFMELAYYASLIVITITGLCWIKFNEPLFVVPMIISCCVAAYASKRIEHD